MILVTGATGQLGNDVLRYLLPAVGPENLIALVRDEQKAAHWKNQGVAIRVGDYTDQDSLVRAFRGVDKLLLISINSPEVLQDHQRAVDAAKKAQVGHVFYTSGALNPQPHSELGPLHDAYLPTEAYLKASGLTYTIFQNGLYAEVLPFFMGEQAIETGIYFPAGEGRASFAKREEMAEVIAQLLVSEGHENRTYPLAGDQTYSFHDLARLLSEIAGKEVAYTSPTPAAFEAQLARHGVPEEARQYAALFARIIRNGEYDVADTTLARLLQRPPTSVPEYLREVYAKKG